MRIGVVLRAGEGDNLVNGVVADARAATAVGIGAAWPPPSSPTCPSP